MILNLINSPAQVISKVQEGSDIGWIEDSNNSVYISSFGLVQILTDEKNNRVEINPIEGETELGWESLSEYICDEDMNLTI